MKTHSGHNIKVKISSSHQEDTRRSGVKLHSFLISALDVTVRFTPRPPIFPRKESPVPTEREAMWKPEPV